MEPNGEGFGTSGDDSTNTVPGPLPDREVVAQIALDLARVNADPQSEASLAAVRSDIEAHGLPAYFHAAMQTVAAEQVRAEQVRAAQEMQAPVTFGPEPFAAPLEIPAPAVIGRQGRVRQTWLNCIGSRTAQPLGIFYPLNLEDLQSIIQQAEANRCRVKAVGSGHSFADVGGTRDFLVETHGLCQPLPLESDLLRPGANPGTLFAVEAGITIRALIEA
jgi:hypothetical protein